MKRAITFDDVLIVPKYSEITSRSYVDVSTKLCDDLTLPIPILSAPMDSVTEHELAIEMLNLGCGAVLHRYNTPEKQSLEVKKICDNIHDNFHGLLSIAIGIRSVKAELERIRLSYNVLKAAHKEKRFFVTIDVAHADHADVYTMIELIKKEYPQIRLCVGNICTSNAATRMKKAGVDFIKAGVGPGSCCETRTVTGCGYPQLSAILEISDEVDIPIIADGGIKNSGDIVKALAGGASSVMIGSLIASCQESCAKSFIGQNGRTYKIYRGMASIQAQKEAGIDTKFIEGESVIKEQKGHIIDTIEKLVAGIKSGFSYVGAGDITELQNKVEFVEISNGTHLENAIRND